MEFGLIKMVLWQVIQLSYLVELKAEKEQMTGWFPESESLQYVLEFIGQSAESESILVHWALIWKFPI